MYPWSCSSHNFYSPKHNTVNHIGTTSQRHRYLHSKSQLNYSVRFKRARLGERLDNVALRVLSFVLSLNACRLVSKKPACWIIQKGFGRDPHMGISGVIATVTRLRAREPKNSDFIYCTPFFFLSKFLDRPTGQASLPLNGHRELLRNSSH